MSQLGSIQGSMLDIIIRRPDEAALIIECFTTVMEDADWSNGSIIQLLLFVDSKVDDEDTNVLLLDKIAYYKQFEY